MAIFKTSPVSTATQLASRTFIVSLLYSIPEVRNRFPLLIADSKSMECYRNCTRLVNYRSYQISLLYL